MLELAPGTGNNTVAFCEDLGCDLVAVEVSSGMIARARDKGTPGVWLRGSALHLPLADGQFDFITATYLLHHVPTDLPRLFGECRRVLRRGCAAFVTVPHGFITSHPINAYFPSFAAVDLARFPDLGVVESALRDAGFGEVGSHTTVDAPKPIDARYVEKVAAQFISTYALLPPDEFEAGVARLRSDVAAHGELATPVAREASVVWGFV